MVVVVALRIQVMHQLVLLVLVVVPVIKILSLIPAHLELPLKVLMGVILLPIP
jgi:hypothetical protein